MKIKLYIVTYNNATDLNKNLETLFLSDLSKYQHEIYVINNHSQITIESKFKEKIQVLHNVLRPDFSRGHLARNWNQALVNGFQNLNSPDCDILIHAQDDTLWKKDCFERLLHAHDSYNFITDGHGDNICSYTTDAVKAIGLWDERYCTVCYQDADYFLRALIYNKEQSSINDFYHPRKLNLLEESLIVRPKTNDERAEARRISNKLNEVCRQLFIQKWGDEEMRRWEDPEAVHLPSRPAIPSFITYPYFENDIPELHEKGYFTGEEAFRTLLPLEPALN